MSGRDDYRVEIECDGTPASIAAAVEKARKSDRPE